MTKTVDKYKEAFELLTGKKFARLIGEPMNTKEMEKNPMPFDGLHEECGVFGMYDFDGGDVASDDLLRPVRTAAQGAGELRYRGQ